MNSFENYQNLEKYIHGPMRKECSYMIGSVISALNYFGCKGNMLEIGVLKGRSAIAAACFLQSEEKFYAVDPFYTFDNNEVMKFGGVGSKELFYSNWRKTFGDTENLILVNKEAKEFFREVDNRQHKFNMRFKYVSIDGDHSYSGTLMDLNNCKGLINDLGVISIDDVFNLEWPSVSEALNDFLRKNWQFAPFCCGWGRLFLCKREVVKKIQNKTKTVMESYRKSIGPNFRILKSFSYYGNEIDIYTNRWGSASKADLNQNAYKLGLRYQQFEEKVVSFIRLAKSRVLGLSKKQLFY